jgi:succinate-acetate transporter protein
MVLWLVVAFIVLSATLILALSFGPLRVAGNVGVIRAFAGVQYAAAALLAGARLTGNA